MFSAFWHGLEPGFYVLFLMMTFLNDMSQDVANSAPLIEHYIRLPWFIREPLLFWFPKQIYAFIVVFQLLLEP